MEILNPKSQIPITIADSHLLHQEFLVIGKLNIIWILVLGIWLFK